jgi:hypothetical protein
MRRRAVHASALWPVKAEHSMRATWRSTGDQFHTNAINKGHLASRIFKVFFYIEFHLPIAHTVSGAPDGNFGQWGAMRAGQPHQM